MTTPLSDRWPRLSLCALLNLLLLVAIDGVPAAAQPFSYSYVDTDLTPVNFSSLSVGDIDGDGDLDVALSGNVNSPLPYLPRVFVSKSISESFNNEEWLRSFDSVDLGSGLWLGTVEFLDFNGDGSLDLFVTGSPSSQPPFDTGSGLYLGAGDGSFSPVGISVPGLFAGASSWGDYDGDGDDDLLMTGSDSAGDHRTILYANESGTLQEISTSLPGLAYGDAQWGDIDNDGDLDLVLVGATTDGVFVSDVYANSGEGQFTAMAVGFVNPVFATIDMGDFDSDGDLDVAIGGGFLSTLLFDSSVHVYRNDLGSFAHVAGMDGAFYGEVRWGDHDNDGDLDLLTIGSLGAVGSRVTRIFENRGAGNFVQQVNFPGLSYSAARYGDYDDDGDLDVMISGLDRENRPLFNIYRNDQLLINTAPAAPTGLSASVDNGSVTLRWQSGSDERTAAEGLSYDVRIGTSPGAADVRSSVSHLGTGKRAVPVRGNNGVTRVRNLTLSTGTYYWSVQSIDNSFVASVFAEEQSFVIVNQDINTGIENIGDAATVLLDPFPNPARETITIPYQLAVGDHGTVSIYSSIGQRVTVIDLESSPGDRSVTWNGTDDNGLRIASGIYFVRLETRTESQTRTVVVAR